MKITVKELAAKANCKPVTANSVLRFLVDQGKATVAGSVEPEQKRKGRKATAFDLSDEAASFLGVTADAAPAQEG